MCTPLTPEIISSALSQIVQDVFGAMLGLEVAPAGPPWSPGANRLTASVRFTGDWSAALLFECPNEQARHFACRYLSLEPPGPSQNDVADVAGELANMIGGNLKSALGSGLRLSVPSVSNQDTADRADALVRLAFASDEGSFWITVTDN